MGQTLADMVGLFDWNTQVVSSPRAAMESLQRNAPSLILLDLNMPGVDGMEVCRFIKRDPVAGDTPVVFVTAEDDPGTKARAREAGAMDYLIKPVDIDRLEEILDKLPRKIIAQKPAEKPDTTKEDASTDGAKSEPLKPDTPAPTQPAIASADGVKSEPSKPDTAAAKGIVVSTEAAKPEPPKPSAAPTATEPEPPAKSA
jgi:two-component system cell cycle response regulator